MPVQILRRQKRRASIFCDRCYASRILNTEAPRRAALVRKPARSEWAPKSVAFRLQAYVRDADLFRDNAGAGQRIGIAAGPSDRLRLLLPWDAFTICHANTT